MSGGDWPNRGDAGRTTGVRTIRPGADRGQAHTLEAFSAALILVGSVVFALQVTAVTPLTASTASQHIENQQGSVGRGMLDAAEENGTLRKTVLYYNKTNGSGGNFHDPNEDLSRGSYAAGPPTTFGKQLNETFIDRGIAFNLNILYTGPNGEIDRKPMVNLGVPSDNAVTVTRTLTLFDDEPIYDEDETPNASVDVNESNIYSGEDVAPHSRVYNVVEVELVIWRM